MPASEYFSVFYEIEQAHDAFIHAVRTPKAKRMTDFKCTTIGRGAICHSAKQLNTTGTNRKLLRKYMLIELLNVMYFSWNIDHSVSNARLML